MTDDEFRAAAKRSADIIRQRQFHLRKVDALNEELKELTQKMMFYCGG